MLTYEYKAKTRDGGTTSGHVEARSRRQAGVLLKRRDLFVVSLRSSTESASAHPAVPHATPAELAWNMWQLSMMVDTGLDLSEALACLARQAARPPLRALFEDIERRVREGASLSAAMETHPALFPKSLTALVRASELSGAFKDVLRRAALHLMSDLKTLRKLKGALIYPALMLGLCAAVTVFLLTFVLPRFAGVFASHNATLPLPTRMLLSLSEGLMSHWPLWLVGSAAIVGFTIAWAKSPAGRRKLDGMRITVPIAAPLFNAVYMSRSFSAMALMVKSHVPLIDAIRVVQDIAPNSYYSELWKAMEEQVRVGERLATPMYEAEFIPEAIAQVVDNGDRNGKLDLVFSHLAEFLEDDFKRVLRATTQLVEPCLIILLGGIIAFVAISLMLPLVEASRAVAH